MRSGPECWSFCGSGTSPAGPTALALIGEILQRDLSDPAWWEGL